MKVGRIDAEDHAHEEGDEGLHVPAVLESELPVFLIQRTDVEHAFANEVIVHHHDPEDGSHGRADEVDELRRARLPRRPGIEHEGDGGGDVSRLS